MRTVTPTQITSAAGTLFLGLLFSGLCFGSSLIAWEAGAQEAGAPPSDALPGSVASAPENAIHTSLSALNRVYDALDPGFVPIEQGPVKILISSPAHRVEVFENRLALNPSETWENGVEARFEVNLGGWGDLIAQLETAFGTNPFEDRVVLDRQWVKADAVVKLLRVDGGYEVELLEALTPTVGFQIESRMLDQIVGTCRAFGNMLPGLSCDGLSASLARIEAPLPAAGTRLEIPAGYLSEEERAIFDQFAVQPMP